MVLFSVVKMHVNNGGHINIPNTAPFIIVILKPSAYVAAYDPIINIKNAPTILLRTYFMSKL